ncbi:MAG: CAP domain-containing protein [Pyrinomonadaceae bacterium]
MHLQPGARLITSSSEEIHYSRPPGVSVPLGDARRSEVPAPAAFPSINQATETEQRAFDATNEMRERNGFSPLSWDSELCRMARAHSEKMARLEFFAHETPEGLRLKDRAQAAGIGFHVIGENIAYNQGLDDPGTFAVQRWMISPGHRANMLSREFGVSGIGSFVTRDGRVYLTQIFIAS